jgi:hypothetical protein
MISKKEFYEAATSVLDINTFTFNDDENKVTIKVPIKWEQIINLKKLVLSILGNPHTPERDWEQDPAHWGYKFDAHFFDIDEDTIKIDSTGRLYVDITTLSNLKEIEEKVVEKLLNNEELLDKIADKILQKLTTFIPDAALQSKPCCHTLSEEDDDGEGFIRPAHCP